MTPCKLSTDEYLRRTTLKVPKDPQKKQKLQAVISSMKDAATCSWVVDVDDVKDVAAWMKDVEHSVESVQRHEEEEYWKKPSIYLVPAFIRDVKKTAFTPQVCSFGPYHHGAAHLMPVEEHKRRALVHFLKRSERPLSHLMAAMGGIAQELQDSYLNLADKWRKDQQGFLKMMILDGCFMLEVIRMKKPDPNKYREIYAANDPVFGSFGIHHRLPYIRRDMLVLENQLPLLVLKILVIAERAGPKPDCPLTKYTVSAGSSSNDIVTDGEINNLVCKFFVSHGMVEMPGLGLHPLDVFRRSLLRSAAYSTMKSPASADPRRSIEIEIVRSAVELHTAGIHFRKSDDPCLMSITFCGGVLTLPFLVVNDATEYEFLNMIAFEQIHVGAGNCVTAFASFMDQLVDSDKDVNLLQEKGILRNALGSDGAIAEVVNGLTKEVTLEPEGYLEEVKKSINVYCRKRWYRWIANFVHTHGKNPWTVLALLAGILVILLTAVQTAYSILSYHHPPSN